LYARRVYDKLSFYEATTCAYIKEYRLFCRLCKVI